MDQFEAIQKSSKNWKADLEVQDGTLSRFFGVLCGMTYSPALRRALANRLQELVDGDEQRIFTSDAATFRNELFNTTQLKAMVSHLSDDDLEALAANLGGHDMVKINAAYAAAEACTDKPTIILQGRSRVTALGLHLLVGIQLTARRRT